MNGNDIKLTAPLRFNFVYETLSDQGYPLMNTITQDPNIPMNGWSSVRYCSYPQVIIIKFLEVVTLREIKLLFHQYKIPNQVDVFIYNPTFFENYYLDPFKIPFERIGYINPSSNEHNEFKVREQKAIMMNVTCLYMKLSLHECYENGKNLFGQVGLIRIECFGRGEGNTVGKKVELYENEKVKASCFMELLIRDDDYDDLTKAKIRRLKNRLYGEKNEAVVRQMNNALEELRVLGRKMINLRQLERNYELVKDNRMQMEMWKEMNMLHRTIEEYFLPENSYTNMMIEPQQEEISIKEIDQLDYNEISNDNYLQEEIESNKNIDIIDGDDNQSYHEKSISSSHSNLNEINNNNNIISNQYQYYNAEKTNAVLEKFRNKKNLIEQSHYDAKDAITRENILYRPQMNL